MRVSVADMEPLKQFIDAVAGLTRALGECRDLPQPVTDAAGEVRKAVVALGGRDIGPPP